MRKIRIKICEFDRDSDALRDNFIYKILKKYYDVEFSENPEYIFYNESTFKYLKYDCIRIFYTGENISPNFNLCDYAIGYDYMNFEDRYYRLPLYLVAVFYNEEEIRAAGDDYLIRRANFSKNDLSEKSEFCSFVYSNYLADGARKTFFDKLSNYKKVNAGGAYLNNIGGRVVNKLEFESKHKFSIAFENTSRSGYTTEKIVGSLAAKTIPIYWGNPEIGREFNEKRFINCHRFRDFDQVVERVKEIDMNNELYLSIINEQIAAPNYDFTKVKLGFDVFLRNIIDQPLSSARRRTLNSARLYELENNEKFISLIVLLKFRIKKFFAVLYKPLKKIGLFEKFKHFILRKVSGNL